jgi:hypothetical protein
MGSWFVLQRHQTCNHLKSSSECAAAMARQNGGHRAQYNTLTFGRRAYVEIDICFNICVNIGCSSE